LFQAAAEKGKLARGPELTMELFTPKVKGKRTFNGQDTSTQRQKSMYFVMIY
jgi:hypothetical protein